MADGWEDAPGQWEDAPSTRKTPKQMKAEAPKSLLERAGETAYGLFEPGVAIATGTVGSAVGGLAGLGRAALPGPAGAGADVSRRVSQALIYEPTTGIGKAATDVASYPFVKLSELGEKAGGAATDITGSPLVGAGISTAIQGAPIALGELARVRAMRPERLTPEQAATRENVAKATREGYVLTPSQADLGAVKKTLEGLTGSAKMEKLASLKNQPITNALIKEDLGIPEGVKPTRELLASMRRQEGANYEAIRNAGTITADQEFLSNINNIEGPYRRIAEDFPKSRPPAILGELEAIKEPSFSSSSAIDKIRELRDKSDTAFRQGDKSLGKDLKDAANALENQIGRHLEKTSAFQQPGLLEAFRQSRAKIAKLYTAEKALNSQTGNFNAQVLARELKRGRPLTGGMKKVGEAGSAFSGSLRDVDAMRDRTEFGFGDLFLGGLGHMITGNWPALATVAARPAIRHAMLTRGPTAPLVPMSTFAQDVARNRTLIPLSTLGQRNQQ